MLVCRRWSYVVAIKLQILLSAMCSYSLLVSEYSCLSVNGWAGKRVTARWGPGIKKSKKKEKKGKKKKKIQKTKRYKAVCRDYILVCGPQRVLVRGFKCLCW